MAKTEQKEDVKKGTGTAGVPAPASPAPLPAVIEDYGTDALAGFEGTTKDDFAIPFLQVLQKMSPQVDDQAPEFIPEARAGMLFNNVTKELTPGQTGVRFIPVHRTHQFLQWVPRDAGGGLAGIHQPDAEIVKPFLGKVGKHNVQVKVEKDGKLVDATHELIETYSVFGLLVREDDTTEPVILNFSSTSIKVYRQWMTRAMGIKVAQSDGRKVVPPLFAHVYRLTVKGESNNKGSWHALNVSFDGPNATGARLSTTSPLYQEAKAFRALAAEHAEASLRQSSRPQDGEEEDRPL